MDVSGRRRQGDRQLVAEGSVGKLQRSRDPDGADVDLDHIRGAVLEMRQEFTDTS